MIEPAIEGGERIGGAERVAYFVVRIRVDHANPAATLTGTLERLGSGRSRHFSGAEELLRLLTERAQDAPRPRRAGSE
jgi:hypothetical protein